MRRTRQHMYGGTELVLAEVVFNEDTSAPYTATMPASVGSGELLILAAIQVGGTGGPTSTPPSDWTILDSTSGTYAIFYKWAAGTEGGTAVTINATGTITLLCTVLRITGADPAQNPQISTLVSGTSAIPNPGAVDPSWADANNLFIALAQFDDNQAVTIYPTGYDLFQQSNVGTTGASGVAAKASASSAAENPGTFTFAGSNNWIAHTIAVKGT